jgi:hypothetical protein
MKYSINWKNRLKSALVKTVTTPEELDFFSGYSF